MSLLKYCFIYLVAIIGGIILGLPWVSPNFAPVIFFGWVIPIIVAERTAARFWVYTSSLYILFVSWNTVSAWWIWNSTPSGALMAFFANSILMLIPFLGYRIVRIRFGFTKSYIAFGLLYLCFEYMHFNWEAAYPWLTLGNAFAFHPTWIQWYEFTGVAGGSIWVLIANYFFISWIRKVYEENPFLEIKIAERILFLLGFIYILSLFKISNSSEVLLRSMRSLLGIIALLLFGAIVVASELFHKDIQKIKKTARYYFLIWAAIIIIPLSVVSPLTAWKHKNFIDPHNTIDSNLYVHIIQPNVDPYNEKYSADYKLQLDSMFQIINALHINPQDQKFHLFVLPETFLPATIDKNNINNNPQIVPLTNYCKQYPHAQFITGAFLYQLQKQKTKFSQQDANGNYYEYLNVALQVTDSGVKNIYVKSKLVPGAEIIPYQYLFSFFSVVSINLGGVNGTLATQDNTNNFTIFDSLLPTPLIIGPVICYESAFGEHCSEYVKDNANLLAIITNDAWWGNTQGYRYLNAFAGLRAIETRRYIIRSANSGISCVYDDFGNMIHGNPSDILYWEQKGSITNHRIKLSDTKTFYVQYGDYLYFWASIATILWFIILIYLNKTKETEINIFINRKIKL